MNHSYGVAQQAIASLKSAIYEVLKQAPGSGLRNAQIGRALGIHLGHSNQHAGHITRVLLDTMRAEGVVQQCPDTKVWSLSDSTRFDEGNDGD